MKVRYTQGVYDSIYSMVFNFRCVEICVMDMVDFMYSSVHDGLALVFFPRIYVGEMITLFIKYGKLYVFFKFVKCIY